MTTKRCMELEFELAVTGILEDIYDLQVCTKGDAVNRRRSGYAALAFDYEYGEELAKVVIRIDGCPESFAMEADLETPEDAIQSAQDCEDLALAIRTHLDSLPGADDSSQRRWDD